MEEGEPTGGVAAVEKALQLLDAFHDANSSLTLADLAEKTGLFKSAILRIFISLERHRYVRRLDNGHFVLGGAAFDLGNAYRRTFSLIDTVRPMLEDLSARTRESASFWTIEDNYRICSCRVESPQALRDALFREGDRLPLEGKGPTSTLLCAFSGAPGKRFDEVRREGAVVSVGLYRPDVAGISCPVFGPGPTLAGAIALTGASQRFVAPALERMKEAVAATAQAITTSLNGSNPYQELSKNG